MGLFGRWWKGTTPTPQAAKITLRQEEFCTIKTPDKLNQLMEAWNEYPVVLTGLLSCFPDQKSVDRLFSRPYSMPLDREEWLEKNAAWNFTLELSSNPGRFSTNQVSRGTQFSVRSGTFSRTEVTVCPIDSIEKEALYSFLGNQKLTGVETSLYGIFVKTGPKQGELRSAFREYTMSNAEKVALSPLQIQVIRNKRELEKSVIEKIREKEDNPDQVVLCPLCGNPLALIKRTAKRTSQDKALRVPDSTSKREVKCINGSCPFEEIKKRII